MNTLTESSGATPGIEEYRRLYLAALDPEAWFGTDPADAGFRAIRAALSHVGAGGPDDTPSGEDAAAHAEPGPAPTDLAALISAAREWSATTTERYRRAFGTGDRATLVQRVLLDCAPLNLNAGAWLQWLSSAGNAETEAVLRVLALYASDVGVGRADASRGDMYRELMRRHGVEDAATTPIRLATSDRVASESFRLPALLLGMSRRPDAFRAEILGADLCLRAVGCLPPIAAVSGDLAVHADPLALDVGSGRPEDDASALERSSAAAEAFLSEAETPAQAARFRNGFHWALAELSEWCDRLLGELTLTHHPDYDMWRLICTRARQAAVYHREFYLEGLPLSEWFQNLDAGPTAFLGALARSHLVKPGRPDASPLIRGLIGEKGPMFRVFTDTDVVVIRAWIESLPDPGSVLHRSPDEEPPEHAELREAQHGWYRPDEPRRAEAERGADRRGREANEPSPAAAVSAGPPPVPSPSGGVPVSGTIGGRSLRDAYHALLNREDPTGNLRDLAYAYATRWLARSRYRLAHAPNQLPHRWDREQGLRTWLGDQHARHGAEYDDGETPIPAREDLIDSTLQLAPLILIDGGWLQGFTDYDHASSGVGHFLFQTYWDELGNGEIRLNHPLIYRNLLREMDIELPPTSSREFADWPGFHDASFALPVYWLCISRFPRTFMPEILGLNLAMELSGVGGGYRSGRVALQHYGYSTQFVDLHNTIDNVSTGHSAWAIDAIDNYMAYLPTVVGPGKEPEMWDRIRVGHRSLTPPTTLMARVYASGVVTTASARGRLLGSRS
ncbi:IopB [Nocardiopsis gilva YIM 90087]|uniref:IopB n=1 Tax=Nocardiopsis gilva YIM 90087 TaxID=1235441 RepID=A0A223S0Z5_9ACTN|nr:iron-containing redox enzyme family protein [Nocardiopsis gilva]ASU81790.1 IopB [Nocardiopsis gilva YIM 90087]